MPKLRLKHTKQRGHDEWETEFDVSIDTPQKESALKRLLRRRWLKDRGKDEFDFEGDDSDLVSKARGWRDEFRRGVMTR